MLREGNKRKSIGRSSSTLFERRFHRIKLRPGFKVVLGLSRGLTPESLSRPNTNSYIELERYFTYEPDSHMFSAKTYHYCVYKIAWDFELNERRTCSLEIITGRPSNVRGERPREKSSWSTCWPRVRSSVAGTSSKSTGVRAERSFF